MCAINQSTQILLFRGIMKYSSVTAVDYVHAIVDPITTESCPTVVVLMMDRYKYSGGLILHVERSCRLDTQLLQPTPRLYIM